MFMRTVGPTSFLTRRRWAYEDLVYGINYSPELTGIGKYTGEMVAWMAREGHEVRVITAPPYYPQWKVGERYSARRYRRKRARLPSGAARCMCRNSPPP